MDKKFKMGMSNINEALPALLRFIGLVLSCLVLTTVSGAIRLITAFGYFLVGVIEGSTGASPKKYMKFHTQRHENTNLLYNGNANSSVIDERLTLFNSLSQNKTGLSEEAMIEKTHHFISPEVNFGSKQPDVLADDFQFVFPVVGPLNKTEFCKIFGGFNIDKAFPLDDDRKDNYFGFTIDPTEPNRVWFFARSRWVHKGLIQFGKIKMEPTMKKIDMTPQVLSVCFDNEGKCYKFTGGYPVDRSSGNCDGLGGFFGIMHSITPDILPFPEGRPWKPSVEWETLVKRVPRIQEEWNNFLKAFETN